MERVTPREDSAVRIDVQVDITIGDFQAVEQLLSEDMSDACRFIGVSLPVS